MLGMPSIINKFGNLALKAIGEFHASPEDKMKMQTAVLAAQREAVKDAMDYEEGLVQEAGKTIRAEIKADSWLTKNWRPIIMLDFGALVTAHWLGFTAPNIDAAQVNGILLLIQIGLGGYVVGRSGEKIASVVMAAKTATTIGGKK